jgi:predicted transcriptional regulator
MSNTKRVPDTNRDRFGIIADMLRQMRIPTCRTNIMSHCNMNTMQSGHYLDLMKSNDLISIGAIAGRVTYQRTEIGREFLELYTQMVLLLDPSISAAPMI